MGRMLSIVLLGVGCGMAPGCALVSPLPMWELVKAGGTAASMAVASSEGRAANTVVHPFATPSVVCLEFNPQVQTAELVPALQAEMHARGIRTRVFDAMFQAEGCDAWLRYSAYVRWDVPPLASDWRPYIETASVTLLAADGKVLASSRYTVDETFGTSKWATTRNKISAVVAAILGPQRD